MMPSQSSSSFQMCSMGLEKSGLCEGHLSSHTSALASCVLCFVNLALSKGALSCWNAKL